MHVLLLALPIHQQPGMIFLAEQYKCSHRFFPHDISVVCLVTRPQERVTPSTASSGVGYRYCRIPMASSRASHKTIRLDYWRHRYKLGHLDDVWLSQVPPLEYGLRRVEPSMIERLQLDVGSTSFCKE